MYLKSISGEKRLELRGDLVAGRSEDCDLVLSVGHPSRRHAQITANEEGVFIEDLGSTNGTFVNERQVEASTRLQAGDRVRFDAEEFEVVDPDAAAPDANATVLRAPDPAATVLRSPAESAATGDKPVSDPARPQPPPAAEGEPEPGRAEPASAAAPATGPHQPEAAETEPSDASTGSREVAGASGPRRPGAWADPNQAKEGGTMLYDSEQLQALLAEAKPSQKPLVDADVPYLVVTAGAQAGSTIKLKAGAQANVWDVGRDAQRDIRFDENGVSGFHAKIVNEGARWKVIDQMSANGTLVNEKRGTISFLSAGDRIRFGPVECVFQLPSGTAGRRSAAAGSGGGGRHSLTVWIGVAALVAVAVVATLLLI